MSAMADIEGASPAHALNTYQPRLEPGVRLLQFLVVI
jgi:hypothetical protein